MTLLVIYERLNILKDDLALIALYSYNLHPGRVRRGLATPQSLVPLLSLGF
jgi:hypothetical protein